jgi:hypothetical protein
MSDSWFVMGINIESGEHITYHLLLERRSDTEFCQTPYKAPEWVGHTPDGAFSRLKKF